MIRVKKDIMFRICLILLAAFSVMKLYRNSFGLANTSVGGIWNVIGLLFCFIGLLLSVGILYRSHKIDTASRLAIAGALISQFNALFFLDAITVDSIYNYICIGYYAFVLMAFAGISDYSFEKKETWITDVSFFAIFGVTIYSFALFLTGGLSFLYVSNVYYPLCFLPMVMCVPNSNKIRYLAYVLVAVAVIMSGKRAGLIAFALCVLLNVVYRTKQQKKSILRVLVILLFCYAVFILAYNALSDVLNINLLERMTHLVEDGGSGRVDIYRDVWESVKEGGPIDWIFGHGRFSAGNVISNGKAHDDFLQALYDFGIIPFILLVLFYLSLFIEGIKMLRSGFDKAPYFLGEIIICLMLSLFSNFVSSTDYVTCGMACLGVFIGQWNDYKRKKVIIDERNAKNENHYRYDTALG